MGYRFKSGTFRVRHAGHGPQLYAECMNGDEIPISSRNPKVLSAAGNCLMGHMCDEGSIACAWIHSAGVRQMSGYIMPTWFGYSGWGVHKYFTRLPGRFSFAEAFFANMQTLLAQLNSTESPTLCQSFVDGTPSEVDKFCEEIYRTCFATDESVGGVDRAQLGLHYDRDHIVFYGDPCWDARLAMESGNCAGCSCTRNSNNNGDAYDANESTVMKKESEGEDVMKPEENKKRCNDKSISQFRDSQLDSAKAFHSQDSPLTLDDVVFPSVIASEMALSSNSNSFCDTLNPPPPHVLPYSVLFEERDRSEHSVTWRCIVRVHCCGTWTSPSPDDKSAAPGRPPFAFLPRDGVSNFKSAEVLAGPAVATRLFVLFQVHGPCAAGETIEAIIKGKL